MYRESFVNEDPTLIEHIEVMKTKQTEGIRLDADREDKEQENRELATQQMSGFRERNFFVVWSW